MVSTPSIQGHNMIGVKWRVAGLSTILGCRVPGAKLDSQANCRVSNERLRTVIMVKRQRSSDTPWWATLGPHAAPERHCGKSWRPGCTVYHPRPPPAAARPPLIPAGPLLFTD
eukprot:384952-Hanusia_phi.AAC.1